jgi:hypothetical protein
MVSSDLTDIHAGTKKWIIKWCRQFKPDHVDWSKASKPDPGYNCMGFAVGVLRWWQPRIVSDGVLLNPTDYWPPGVPDRDDIEGFVRAAESVRFKKCL